MSEAGDAPIDGVAGRPGASLQRKAGAVQALSDRIADTVEAIAGRRPVRSRGEEGQTERANPARRPHPAAPSGAATIRMSHRRLLLICDPNQPDEAAVVPRRRPVPSTAVASAIFPARREHDRSAGPGVRQGFVMVEGNSERAADVGQFCRMDRPCPS